MSEGANWQHRLVAELTAPPNRVDLDGLLDLWTHDDVVIRCRRPSDLEDSPDLPLRTRGALGNALETLGARAGARPDPFDRPSAHWQMFQWTSSSFARPYVTRAEVRGDKVEMRVRLFGFAAFHGPAVLQALCTALEDGVSIRNHGVRARFAVIDATVERFCGPTRDWRRFASSTMLTLLTPLIVRRGQSIRIDPLSLMRSALRRAEMVAPWMHCTLEHDAAELMARVETFRFDLSEIHPERWIRTSRRNPGKGIPVEGYAGRILIDGNLGSWATYLDLAQYASLGGECALGCGAVRATFFT